MIIETNEAILVEENEDLALVVMGGIWGDFKKSIPEIQAKVLTEGFNLILLSNTSSSDINELLDPDSMSGFTNSTLPTIMTNLLVDDTIHTAEKKNLVFEHITGNIIELLVKMGFTINQDEASEEYLAQLTKIGSLFYDFEEYQDLIGLCDILASRDIPPKERYLLVMERYLGDTFDLDVYERLIEDVSEVTIKAIHDGLRREDASEGVPDNIVERVVGNKDLLEGTIAFAHIRNNGQLGGSVESFMSFFGVELDNIQTNSGGNETKAQFQYAREVLALFMCSELNNNVIRDSIMRYMSTRITDYPAMVKFEALVQKLVLTHE